MIPSELQYETKITTLRTTLNAMYRNHTGLPVIVVCIHIW